MKLYRGKHTICLSSNTYLSEYNHLYLIWIFSVFENGKIYIAFHLLKLSHSRPPCREAGLLLAEAIQKF